MGASEGETPSFQRPFSQKVPRTELLLEARLAERVGTFGGMALASPAPIGASSGTVPSVQADDFLFGVGVAVDVAQVGFLEDAGGLL